VREQKRGEGGGGPEPANLYKVDVEGVALAGKVRGRQVRRLEGLVGGRVGGGGSADGGGEGGG
jgi:hypothetical protein